MHHTERNNSQDWIVSYTIGTQNKEMRFTNRETADRFIGDLINANMRTIRYFNIVKTAPGCYYGICPAK